MLFSVFSFCLTYCFLGLLSTACRFVVPIFFWCVPPVGKVGSVACVGFLVEEAGSCVLVLGMDLFFLVVRTAYGGVFWGVCELSMI